jgi:hypothetical protein
MPRSKAGQLPNTMTTASSLLLRQTPVSSLTFVSHSDSGCLDVVQGNLQHSHPA